MKQKLIFVGLLLLGLISILAACTAPEPTAAPESAALECPECPAVECPEAECPTCPEPEPCPQPLGGEVPYEALWASSAHAQADAEAFRRWDEDDPAVVETDCAKCHSTVGYADFLGADGSEAGLVNNEAIPAAENVGIQCVACHNDATTVKTSVVMPSGIELTGLGDEARCMECHQGRESKVSVDARIATGAGVENGLDAEPDTVIEGLRFANIHYFAAAATKYGTLAKGGYEYEGTTYDGNFAHVEEFDTCIECHDSHTLQVRVEACVECHGEGEPNTFRMAGSAVDFDGDGDIEEGIAFEIAGMQEALLAELQAYSTRVTGAALTYDAETYPYFLNEAGEGYATWTPRLLRAAYNYQLSQKDPGAFAHGGKYVIELLYDSIADLNPEAVANLKRIDHGHFAGSQRAFRYWDEDGEVEANCARCHTATGIPTFFKEGVNISAEISNGFQCTTCHDGANWPARFVFSSVTFPSGKTAEIAEGNESGLCMQCHQGRESGASVDRAIAGLELDAPMEGQRFINVHYFAAGATRFGAEAGGGYEYAGKTYVGLFPHAPGFDTCTSCHNAHEMTVKTDQCFTCHAGYTEVTQVRFAEDVTDYDGDGDAAEGIAGEIATMKEALYAAIVANSANTEGIVEVKFTENYPYWAAAEEGATLVWTPRLLQAAYNFQYATKDPGGFAHNGKYVMQLLIDSIEAIGGDVTGMTRPEATAPAE